MDNIFGFGEYINGLDSAVTRFSTYSDFTSFPTDMKIKEQILRNKISTVKNSSKYTQYLLLEIYRIKGRIELLNQNKPRWSNADELKKFNKNHAELKKELESLLKLRKTQFEKQLKLTSVQLASCKRYISGLQVKSKGKNPQQVDADKKKIKNIKDKINENSKDLLHMISVLSTEKEKMYKMSVASSHESELKEYEKEKSRIENVDRGSILRDANIGDVLSHIDTSNVNASLASQIDCEVSAIHRTFPDKVIRGSKALLEKLRGAQLISLDVDRHKVMLSHVRGLYDYQSKKKVSLYEFVAQIMKNRFNKKLDATKKQLNKAQKDADKKASEYDNANYKFESGLELAARAMRSFQNKIRESGQIERNKEAISEGNHSLQKENRDLNSQAKQNDKEGYFMTAGKLRQKIRQNESQISKKQSEVPAEGIDAQYRKMYDQLQEVRDLDLGGKKL